MPTIRSGQIPLPKGRTQSNFQPRVSPQKTSKPLHLPSSLSSDIFRIINHVAIKFCHRFIFAPPSLKIFIHFGLIIIGPFLKNFHVITNASLSAKANILNQHIANMGWTWSISLLIPFVYLTSLIYTRAHYGWIMRHLGRLIIATVIWYVVTYLFIHIESMTGMCKPSTKHGFTGQFCRSNRYQWQEGHRFFLLYAILIINEEANLYGENWYRIEDANKLKVGGTNGLLNQSRMKIFSLPIGMLYIALAVLTVLWEFMLLSTVFYIYNILHKLIAVSFAVFFWFITYRVWYRRNNTLNIAPCAPGDGFITF